MKASWCPSRLVPRRLRHVLLLLAVLYGAPALAPGLIIPQPDTPAYLYASNRSSPVTGRMYDASGYLAELPVRPHFTLPGTGNT